VTNELVFGTDNLQDDTSKLIKLCAAVTGGRLPDGKYDKKEIAHAVTTADRAIIDFFKKELGTKRRAVTFLVSAGLRRMYHDLNTYPTSLYQMEQIYGAIANTDEIHYILLDNKKLKLSLSNYETIEKYYVEVPREIWGMICSIGMDLKVYPKHLFVYLIRIGIVDYNAFVETFSSHIKIMLWMLKFSKESTGIFLLNLKRLYKDKLNLILDLYEECKNIKQPYSDEIVELMSMMEQVIKDNNL